MMSAGVLALIVGSSGLAHAAKLARRKRKFRHDYKFTDPVTKRVLPRSTYCERVESTAVWVGIYKG
jgi:cytochrome c